MKNPIKVAVAITASVAAIILVMVLTSLSDINQEYDNKNPQVNNSVTPAPSPVSENPSTQAPAYMLATIQDGSGKPPQDLVNIFQDELYRLTLKCPKETEINLSDYIVTAHQTITKRRPVFTLLQVSQGFNDSVPQNNGSVGAKCSDYMAIYMALTLQGG